MTEIKILQLFYAGILAESANYYNNAGIIERISETKFNQQKIAASKQLKQLGIRTHRELFSRFSDIFGYIEWNITEKADGFTVTGDRCLICSISKRIGNTQPCQIYCINPYKLLVKALDPSINMFIRETLWNGDKCEFKLNKNS